VTETTNTRWQAAPGVDVGLHCGLPAAPLKTYHTVEHGPDRLGQSSSRSALYMGC
jgi:hypothetical protein